MSLLKKLLGDEDPPQQIINIYGNTPQRPAAHDGAINAGLIILALFIGLALLAAAIY